MAAQAFATADTLPASREAEMLVTPAQALRMRLQARGGAPSPREMVHEIARRVYRLGLSKPSFAQHALQSAVFAAGREGTANPLSSLAVGVIRLQLLVPARLRLVRWQARRALLELEESGLQMIHQRGSARRLARHVLPIAALLTATVACSLVSHDKHGEDGSHAWGPAPELSKPKAAPEHVRRSAPWSYVLPVDHGVRADQSGQGHFRAPRFHGEHNGLDLLAPVGTPVFAPCTGKAMAGVSRSFGNWIHVICPVPDAYMKKGGPTPWASFFYAHLDSLALPNNKWMEVEGASQVGTVGKTGNARGPNIQPHLHLELIVQKNRRSAMDERHLGADQTSVPAAEFFVDSLSEHCMSPFGFEPKSQLLRRARRIDPFVALTCLSDYKPNYLKAPSPLTEASRDWSQFYVAKDFNVNLGVEDSRLARR